MTRDVLDGLWTGAAILLAVWILALATTANAHDAKHPELNDWVAGLTNKHGKLCCNGRDTFPAEAVYDTDTGHYRARLEDPSDHTWGWYDVPDDVVVTEPNRLGYAAAWYYPSWDRSPDGTTFMVPKWRCFIPGAGG